MDLILAECNQPGTSLLEAESHWINTAFGGDTVEEILAAVHEAADQGHELAQKALKALQRNSPTGMKVALEAIRRAKQQTLAETLIQDLRTTMNAIAGTEFAEGIRAQLIDKDRNPQWSPAHLEDVTDEAVQGFFDPVDGVDELVIKM